MRKFSVFLVNAVLFAVLFAFVGWAYLCAVSYLEIIFSTPMFISWVIFPIAVLWIGTAIVLYFYVSRRRYGKLTGTVLVEYFSKGGVSLKSVGCYFSVIGMFVVLYFVGLGINHFVFGHYLKEQEKRLESMGVSMDWRSYYPDIDYNDPENAAPIIEKAGEELSVAISSDKFNHSWFVTTTDREVDWRELSEYLAVATPKAAKPLADYERAIKYNKFLCCDYRGVKWPYLSEFTSPKFSHIRHFVQLRTLQSIVSAKKNDWESARRYMSSAIALTNLLEQDPHLVTVLIRSAAAVYIRKGIGIVVREAADKNKAMEFASWAVGSFYKIEMAFTRAAMSEVALVAEGMGELSGEDAVEMMDGFEILESKGLYLNRFVATYLFGVFYKLFGSWDRYVFLTHGERNIKIVLEKDFIKVREREMELNKFMEGHTQVPALTSSCYMYSAVPFLKRKFGYDAGNDTTLLFAYAVAYKAKHGKYPVTLDKLAPVYMKAIPKNPFTGKPYEYVTKGDYMEIITFDDEGKSVGSPVYMGKRPEKKVDGEKNLKK